MIRTMMSWRAFARSCRVDGFPSYRHLASYIRGHGPEDQTLADAVGCVRAVLARPAQVGAGDTLAGDILDLVALAVEGRNARERLSRMIHPSQPSHPAMCRTLAACAQMCHRVEQAEAAIADRGAT